MRNTKVTFFSIKSFQLLFFVKSYSKYSLTEILCKTCTVHELVEIIAVIGILV